MFLIYLSYTKQTHQKYQKATGFVLLYLQCTSQPRLGMKWSWQCTARRAELLNGFRYQAAALNPCALSSTLSGLIWLWLSWTGFRPVLSQAQSTCIHFILLLLPLEKHRCLGSRMAPKVSWGVGLRLLFWHLIISVWSFLLMLCYKRSYVIIGLCYAGTLPKHWTKSKLKALQTYAISNVIVNDRRVMLCIFFKNNLWPKLLKTFRSFKTCEMLAPCFSVWATERNNFTCVYLTEACKPMQLKLQLKSIHFISSYIPELNLWLCSTVWAAQKNEKIRCKWPF